MLCRLVLSFDTFLLPFTSPGIHSQLYFLLLILFLLHVCRLDTGRLNPETYRVFDKVEKHYGIKIEYTFPEAEETMAFVREKGMFSFYEDGHQECCRYRKVESSPCLTL